MSQGITKAVNPYSAEIDFTTSESDLCRRQILMSKVDTHTERIKIFTMAIDP